MVHLLPWAPDGAHILWQHNTETDTLSLSLLCACEQSQKKINETFDLCVLRSRFLSLSLSAAASYMPGMPAVSPYGPNPNSG